MVSVNGVLIHTRVKWMSWLSASGIEVRVPASLPVSILYPNQGIRLCPCIYLSTPPSTGSVDDASSLFCVFFHDSLPRVLRRIFGSRQDMLEHMRCSAVCTVLQQGSGHDNSAAAVSIGYGHTRVGRASAQIYLMKLYSFQTSLECPSLGSSMYCLFYSCTHRSGGLL